MKKITTLLLAVAGCLVASAQTLNVQVGEVTYAVPAADAGNMVYSSGTSLTILEKTFSISDIDQIYVDNSTVTAGTVTVAYSGTTAQVVVPADVMNEVTVTANGAHVSIVQADDVATEITYALSGTSTDGEFYMEGKFKATVELNGLELTNPTGPAINIQNGKRIAVSVKKGTTNTLTDGSGGDWKGCFRCKGHTEFKGKGVLNVYGKTSHAIWSKEYVEVKNCTINVLSAEGDGINCNQYFLMASGELTISGVSDDGIQVSYKTDDAGNVETDAENTGAFTLTGGSIDITVTGNGAKAVKAAGDVNISGGTLTITQSGNIVVEGDDIDYSTSIKAGGNINVTGGTVTVNNTAQGGKALSANGNISIDESAATTTLDLTANGIGGTAETAGNSSATTGSYKVYVSIPTSGGGGPGGGGNAWSTVYLYKSDGTLVQQLTSTVTKSSGYSSATFYYYDFKASDSGTYYFKSADYTSRGWSSGTYAIQSVTFTGPTTGDDIYFSISNSYTTSGSTRTYQLSNVTSTYGGTSESAEDNGTGYNAAGLKADGNITIGGGTITIGNNGAMSKSIKSKGTVTVNGGTLTLKPAGAMQVISGDASYSAGIKAVDFVQNGGSISITATGACARGISADNLTTNGGELTIVNSGAGQTISSADYTAKGLKADKTIALNAGTINITMSGTGGKGIKSSGTYTQGVSGGSGPTLTVKTTGSRLSSSGSSGSSGGWGGWGGSSSGSSAKAIKVQGTAVVYGGETTVTTATDGAEGLESKTSVDIRGGQHYFQCYDDCINSSGKIYFNGGVTVCYSNGNDAVDSNAGTTGAITIGNGVIFAYTTKGSPEEGLDCDNNSYIQITGTGIAISAGGSQGGGGGGWGSSSGNTISNAKQGYAFVTSSISYTANRYYTLSDASGNNLVTYSFPASCSSTLGLFTATGMTSGSTYYIKYSTSAPTDAETAFHGLYLGSSATGTTSVTSFTAK